MRHGGMRPYAGVTRRTSHIAMFGQLLDHRAAPHCYHIVSIMYHRRPARTIYPLREWTPIELRSAPRATWKPAAEIPASFEK
jgi:hypothetical protein